MNKIDATILYIEDHDDVQLTYATFFEKLVKRVVLASDGKEGLDKYLKYKPDLVITDMQMPEMNGIEVARAIKNENENTRIILLSFYTDEELLDFKNAKVFDECFSKPLNYVEVKEIIKKSFNVKTAQREIGHICRTDIKEKEIQQKRENKEPIHEMIFTEAVKFLMPNIVVTNEDMNIVFKRGNLQLLQIQEGYISYNIFKLVDPKLAIYLKEITQLAEKEHSIKSTPLIPVNIPNSEPQFLKVFVLPIIHQEKKLYFYYFMSFNDQEFSQFSSNSCNEELPLIEFEETQKYLKNLVKELNAECTEFQQLYEDNNKVKVSLEEKNFQYEYIFDQINDIVVVSTLKGVFLKTNKITERTLGYDKIQLLTKSWDEISTTPEKNVFGEIYKEVLANGKAINKKFRVLSKDGTEIILSLNSYFFKHKNTSNIWTFATDITERTHFQEKLHNSEKKYKITFEQANIGIAHVAINGQFLSANEKLVEFLGYSKEELLYKNCREVTYEKDMPIDLGNAKLLLSGETKNYQMEKRYIKKDGSITWANLSVALARNSNGKPEYFISVIEDINVIKELSEKQKMAKTVFDTTQEGIVITDKERRILSVNLAFEEISGYKASEVIGKPSAILKSLKHTDEFYSEMRASLKNSGIWSGEIINKTKSNNYYPAFLNINANRDENGEITEYVGVLNDISAIKSSQDRVKHLANHDQLTNLPNRSFFNEEIIYSIDKAKRKGFLLAILFIDLDGFKAINDNYGHKAGDHVLIEVAHRLKSIVRKDDIVSRFGGDEFVILLKNLQKSAIAGKTATKILNIVTEPIEFDKNVLKVGTSIGISIYPNDGYTAEELTKQADIAMYSVKENGKNSYRFASEGKDSIEVFEKLAMKQSILDGLNRDQFEVHYQPIVDRNMDLNYLEALVRWNHPSLGKISPNKFIHLAEESEVINYITDFVLYQVINDINYLQKTLGKKCHISINTSLKNFKSDKIYNKLKKFVQRNSKNTNIIFEMSEKEFLQSFNNKSDWITRFQELGIKFAIDDFGTGYSNLNDLSKLPIHYVKIENAIVSQIGKEERVEKLIKATTSLAHTFDFYSVAEGVEEKQQFDFLLSQSVDFFQGYLISEPKPIKNLINFVKEHLK
jgi:two-component system CheB/CheR fusion protein